MIDLLRRLHRTLGIKYHADRCMRYVRRFGFRRALTEYRRIRTPAGTLQSVNVPGIAHPVLVRAGTADVSTFEHVFLWNDYDLGYGRDVKTIIDAGANTGLAAVFFANLLPAARIISIEPERENFRLLEQNAAPYPNIVPLHAALWNEDMLVGLSNPEDRVDSYRFDPTAAVDRVQAYSIPTILSRFDMERVDVLKIDIEGGETAVFTGNPAWVERVGMFVIELHGPEAMRAFADATARLQGRRWKHGENDVLVVTGPV